MFNNIIDLVEEKPIKNIQIETKGVIKMSMPTPWPGG